MPASRSKGGPGGAKKREIEAPCVTEQQRELETEEGQDMLSHVHPNSEETMRNNLFPLIKTTVLSCEDTVEDGLFNIPDSKEVISTPAPSHNHKVY